ncbi:MAG: SWIM zinc finger family protein [Nitrososphaeraceae archaeon]
MKQLEVMNKQSRYGKGVVIATSRRILRIHNEDAWLVESETTDDKFYKVTEDGTCNCKDFEIRGGLCKHMWALIRRGIA